MRLNKLLLVLLSVPMFTYCGSDGEKSAEVNNTGSVPTDSSILKVKELVGIGKIEPETQILTLSAPRGGIVTGVMKNDGDTVSKGEELILLDSEEQVLDAELIKARILTLENQLALDKASIIEAELRLENKKRLLAGAVSLLETGAETKQNIDDIETEVRLLETGLDKSRTALSVTLSRLTELKIELKEARMELEKRRITAPSDGILLDMKVVPGRSLTQYSDFAEFAPAGGIIARCEVDEMFSGKVKAGQQASITPVGSQEVLARGKVIRSSPFLKRKSLFSEQPGDREDRRVREVWILLDDPGNLLFNMQVECIIKL